MELVKNEIKEVTEESAIALFEEFSKSDDRFPVDFDDAWGWIGFTRKDSALKLLKSEFQEGVEYLRLKAEIDNHAGFSDQDGVFVPIHEKRGFAKIYLTYDGFKQFCLASGTKKAKQVRKYFVAAENRMRQLEEELRKQQSETKQLSPAQQAISAAGTDPIVFVKATREHCPDLATSHLPIAEHVHQRQELQSWVARGGRYAR